MYQAREIARPRSRGAPAEPAGSLQARPLELNGARLVCARCGAFITTAAAKLEVNGAHEHAFINPAGLVFRVGCFAEAPGVRAVGDPSEHWTWFAGFAWRAALCNGCHEHLGWCYERTLASFVALILGKLDERGASDRAR